MTLGRATRTLLCLIVAATGFIARPTLVDAQGGACLDGQVDNFWAGAMKDPAGGASTYVTAIKSNIYIPSSSQYFACSLSGVGNDGPYGWVSLEPGSTNPVSSFNTILQIGILRCTFIQPECGGAIPHFAWAMGGCAGETPLPDDLGTATWSSTNTFEISKSGDSYNLKINGITKVTISKFNIEVWCWIQGDTRGDWSQERWDRGDSAGSNGSTSQRVQLTAMRYATPGGCCWLSPNIGSCYNTHSSGTGRYVCSVQAGDGIHVWTLNP